jgi:hypothetical protein
LIVSISSIKSSNLSPVTVEVARKSDYVICFEIAKHIEKPTQIVIRLSAHNLKKIVLKNFVMMYALPQGFLIQTLTQNSNVLELGKPVFHTVSIQANVSTPLQMKIQVSYLYGAQPIAEIIQVDNSIFQ